MRSLPVLTIALLAAACAPDDGRPVGPGGGGGGGGGGTGTTDGGAQGDGTTGGAIEGRLCWVNDMRNPGLCPQVPGLNGLEIEIENIDTGDKTTTYDNGLFSLPPSSGNIARLRIAFNDQAFTNALIPIGLSDGSASGVNLPLVPVSVWQDLLFFVGVNEPGGTASLASYFVRGANGVPAVSVQPPSGTSGVPFYDGDLGPNDWSVGGATGNFGASIMVGVPAGSPTVSMVATPVQSQNVSITGIPVEANVLTFITVALP